MIVSPLAPALWLAAQLTVVIQLITYLFLKSPILDPFISVLLYLFYMEMSKFVAEMTMREDDG